MTTDQLPRWPLLDDYRVPGLLLLLGFGVLLLPAVVLLARRAAVIVLYTDGLIERRGQDLDAGTARLQATLADLAGRELDELCDELLARMLPDAPEDDVALVAVRLHPQDQPRPAEAGPNRVPQGFPVD